LCQDDAFGVENAGFSEMPAPPAADDAPFDAQRHAAGNWAQVLDLQFARDRGVALRTYSFAHGFIEQRGDDAAVQVAGMAVEGAWDDGETDDAIGCENELEA